MHRVFLILGCGLLPYGASGALCGIKIPSVAILSLGEQVRREQRHGPDVGKRRLAVRVTPNLHAAGDLGQAPEVLLDQVLELAKPARKPVGGSTRVRVPKNSLTAPAVQGRLWCSCCHACIDFSTLGIPHVHIRDPGDQLNEIGQRSSTLNPAIARPSVHRVLHHQFPSETCHRWPYWTPCRESLGVPHRCPGPSGAHRP